MQAIREFYWSVFGVPRTEPVAPFSRVPTAEQLTFRR
jgi:hypothetical protein